MFKFLRIMSLVIVILLLTQTIFAQQGNSQRERFNELINEYGLVPVANIPQDVIPQQIGNPSELMQLINTERAQARVREVAPNGIPEHAVAVREEDIIGIASTFDTTKTCSTGVGLGTYNGYARVTMNSAPIYGGTYNTYVSINSKWWSYTGITTGITIDNVNLNYYLSGNTYLWMRNDFTINHYMIVPWGQVYLYSSTSYKHCGYPA